MGAAGSQAFDACLRCGHAGEAGLEIAGGQHPAPDRAEGEEDRSRRSPLQPHSAADGAAESGAAGGAAAGGGGGPGRTAGREPDEAPAQPAFRKTCRFDTASFQKARDAQTARAANQYSDTPSTCTSAGTPRTFFSTSTATSATSRRSKTDVVVKQYRAARDARERLRAFLKRHGYLDVNMQRKRFWRSSYPLHCAVKHNDADAVRLLLRWGADPGRANSQRVTPHQEAVRRNRHGSHDEVIRILAAAGGDGAQAPAWGSFMSQLAKDPLISRRSLEALARSPTALTM